MKIIWEPKKEAKLKKERNIDFEEIKGIIEDGKYLAVLYNPTKPNQSLFLLNYKAYVHVLVVKIEPDKMIFKTCFPSRKFHNGKGKYYE